MSRYFEREFFSDPSGYIDVAAGALSAVAGGPWTIGLIFRMDATTNDREMMSARNVGGNSVWALLVSGGQMFVTASGFRGGFSPAINTWYMAWYTKAAGNSQVREHICNMATGVWAHADLGTLNDSGTGPVTAIRFSGTSNGPGSYFAAAAVENSVLTDAQVESLQFTLRSWVDLPLDAVWRFNDTPVDDLGTAGADQSVIRGTTVNTGVEPPSFDYDTTPIVVVPPVEPEPPITGGGWNSYLAILKDNEREYLLYKEQELYRPVACPNDGEPLRQGPDGRSYCPFDGWRPDPVSSA